VPDDVELHVLPSGASSSPNISIGHARATRMRERMDSARTATTRYLATLA
jgi:NTE family protein